MDKKEQKTRNTYHKPELRTYADLRLLTEAMATMKGKSDGAYGPFLKTG